MPYECTAGDDAPVVVHLQQLDGDYDQVDFCAEHWVQFIYSTAETLGMIGPEGGLTPEQVSGTDEDTDDPIPFAVVDQADGADQSGEAPGQDRAPTLDEAGQPIPH